MDDINPWEDIFYQEGYCGFWDDVLLADNPYTYGQWDCIMFTRGWVDAFNEYVKGDYHNAN